MNQATQQLSSPADKPAPIDRLFKIVDFMHEFTARLTYFGLVDTFVLNAIGKNKIAMFAMAATIATSLTAGASAQLLNRLGRAAASSSGPSA